MSPGQYPSSPSTSDWARFEKMHGDVVRVFFATAGLIIPIPTPIYLISIPIDMPPLRLDKLALRMSSPIPICMPIRQASLLSFPFPSPSAFFLYHNRRQPRPRTCQAERQQSQETSSKP
ncbi:hypothetical protein CF326_g9137 [Tilletia indica]|nr:hypothetical protein CF326_g9137 [Tilletia indica]